MLSRAAVLLQACDCLYGVLLVAGRVVAVERGAAAPGLNVFDLLLLLNFSSSNESLRYVGHQHPTTQVSNSQPLPAAVLSLSRGCAAQQQTVVLPLTTLTPAGTARRLCQCACPTSSPMPSCMRT